jgi:glycosyltransferase involved in cell wall biosynthesis
VALFQRRLAPFRVPVFERLAAMPDIELQVFTGVGGADAAGVRFAHRTVRTISAPSRRGALQLHPQVVAEILRRRHDVVIVEGSVRVLTGLVIALLKPLHGCSVICWNSLYDRRLGAVAFPRGLRGLPLRTLLRRADAILAYSESAAMIMQRCLPDPGRVVRATNALDTELLQTAEADWRRHPQRLRNFAEEHGLAEGPLVLYVGRLTEEKRVPDLLRAFARIWHHAPPPKPTLAIIGDGIARDRLSELARETAPGAPINFLGEIRDVREICPFFLLAHVFVLPGSGGLAVYHALAHGLPTVATHADGTERDLITDGETGFLCEPGDVESLAARASEILNAPDRKWRAMSEACRRRIEERAHITRLLGAFRDAITTALHTPMPHDPRPWA